MYERGFGEANRAWGIANAPDTRFRIASVTKQFTAALVLQLVEEGLVDLDAPLTQYLPDYPAAQGDRVTIHQLLSHTSGIPEHVGAPGFADLMRDPVEPDSFLSVFSGRTLDFEPGSAYRYSNSGYYVLGVLVERVTGQSYASALRERLLAPLGLDDTSYDDGSTVLDRAASGYVRTGGGFEHAPYVDPSVPYAAGMLSSTARDLFRWTEALHASEPFESPATFDRMTTPVLADYGYGIGVSDLVLGEVTARSVGHDGSIPGFSSFVVHFPESGRTVVVLDNASGGTRTVALNVARVLYGQGAESPERSIGSLLESLIETDGTEAAAAQYREIREGGGEGYDLSEPQLNALGYAYMQRGEIETAIAVFALNVEAYPDSWNPYDSLGEAYLVAGDSVRAAESYQQALARNPVAPSALDALDRLGVEPAIEAVTVPEEALAAYVGRYALGRGVEVEVTREGDTLFAEATGRPKLELLPVSETRFYVPQVDVSISFVRSDDGPAGSLMLSGGGGEDMTGERVE